MPLGALGLPSGQPKPGDPTTPLFPGCRSFRLTRDTADGYEGRFDYWNAVSETAWAVAELTSGAHERPSRRFAAHV